MSNAPELFWQRKALDHFTDAEGYLNKVSDTTLPSMKEENNRLLTLAHVHSQLANAAATQLLGIIYRGDINGASS